MSYHQFFLTRKKRLQKYKNPESESLYNLHVEEQFNLIIRQLLTQLSAKENTDNESLKTNKIYKNIKKYEMQFLTDVRNLQKSLRNDFTQGYINVGYATAVANSLKDYVDTLYSKPSDIQVVEKKLAKFGSLARDSNDSVHTDRFIRRAKASGEFLAKYLALWSIEVAVVLGVAALLGTVVAPCAVFSLGIVAAVGVIFSPIFSELYMPKSESKYSAEDLELTAAKMCR